MASHDFITFVDYVFSDPSPSKGSYASSWVPVLSVAPIPDGLGRLRGLWEVFSPQTRRDVFNAFTEDGTLSRPLSRVSSSSECPLVFAIRREMLYRGFLTYLDIPSAPGSVEISRIASELRIVSDLAVLEWRTKASVFISTFDLRTFTTDQFREMLGIDVTVPVSQPVEAFSDPKLPPPIPTQEPEPESNDGDGDGEEADTEAEEAVEAAESILRDARRLSRSAKTLVGATLASVVPFLGAAFALLST